MGDGRDVQGRGGAVGGVPQAAAARQSPALSCGDVMRFMAASAGARRANGHFSGAGDQDLRRRPEGGRLKHRVNGNSVKRYDKQGSVCGGNDDQRPGQFKAFRGTEAEPGRKAWTQAAPRRGRLHGVAGEPGEQRPLPGGAGAGAMPGDLTQEGAAVPGSHPRRTTVPGAAPPARAGHAPAEAVSDGRLSVKASATATSAASCSSRRERTQENDAEAGGSPGGCRCCGDGLVNACPDATLVLTDRGRRITTRSAPRRRRPPRSCSPPPHRMCKKNTNWSVCSTGDRGFSLDLT